MGNIIPPEPTRIELVFDAICCIRSEVAELAIRERCLYQKFLNQVEKGTIDAVRKPFKKGDDFELKNYWYSLFQAQHLGLKTRLMDWSIGWETALMFTVNEKKHHGKDGSFWVYFCQSEHLFNVDNIEVIKGPSGTLFGSSVISYGGLINIVTKKPYYKFGGEISYNSGTYGLNRVTTDLNLPLNDKAAVRVNAAYENGESFQDAGFTNCLFVAPSLKYQVNDKLTFYINTEIYKNTSVKAAMIFLSRYAPLSFDSIDVFEKNYNFFNSFFP